MILSTLRRSFLMTFQSGTLFFFFFLASTFERPQPDFLRFKKILQLLLEAKYEYLCDNTECDKQPTGAHWRACVPIPRLTHRSDQPTFLCIFTTSPDPSLWNSNAVKSCCFHTVKASAADTWITQVHTRSARFSSPPAPCPARSRTAISRVRMLAVDHRFNPPYHAGILHTATMFNPILLNRLEAIRSERITAAALCATEMRLSHILCWSDTRLEWAEGSRRGQPFSEAETCKCTDSRDKSTITEKTITERWKKKEVNGTGWELGGWAGWYVIASWGKCFTNGIDDWVSYDLASSYSSFIGML